MLFHFRDGLTIVACKSNFILNKNLSSNETKCGKCAHFNFVKTMFKSCSLFCLQDNKIELALIF